MKAEELHNLVFNMRFACKQLEKSAKKSDREALKEREKLKKAMQAGNLEAAKIFGESCIRKQKEGNNYLRLAARVDAAASKVHTAAQMQSVTKALQSAVKGMDKLLTSMDPVQVAVAMEKFEQQVENLDVVLGGMESTFASTDASTVPSAEVEHLLEQVAAENNLDIRAQISSAQKAGEAQFGCQLQEIEGLLGNLQGKAVGA
jgi:charged multivesicular body protein 1